MDYHAQRLLTLLKEKRKEISNREGKEPFMVFHNAVLERTAEALPKTKEELAAIKGWGEKKIAKYGDEILALVNDDTIASKKEKARGILSVGEFMGLVNRSLSQLGIVKVRGEISDINLRAGAVYFDLKDASGEDYIVRCIIWRLRYEEFSHLLEDGFEVIVHGRPNLYKSGAFNIIAELIEPIGEGALRRAFEVLKKKLEAKGYFDVKRKRPLPVVIQKIGLITSETGAVINDFRRNIGEYGFEINLYDVRVEGDSAEKDIVSAVRWFNRNRVAMDVLVLIRGGGGLENLKAFNSEAVADALLSSRIPVIVGIGHEKDETIADFVADMRFSNTTAVAGFLRRGREDLLREVGNTAVSLAASLSEFLSAKRDGVKEAANDLEGTFYDFLEYYRVTVIRFAERMQSGLRGIFIKFHRLEADVLRALNRHTELLQHRAYGLNIFTRNLLTSPSAKLDAYRARLGIAKAQLFSLNPESTLKRGYSIAYAKDGRVIKESKTVEIDEQVLIKLYKGGIVSRVEEIK